MIKRNSSAIFSIQQSLLSNTIGYDYIDSKNDKLIAQLVKIINTWPKIIPFTYHLPENPKFELIDELEEDDDEIRKLVIKTNLTFVGYHCEHECCIQQYNQMQQLIHHILESGDYREYMRALYNIAEIIYNIQNSTADNAFETDIANVESSSKRIVQLVANINTTISSCNRRYHLTCGACEAAMCKYNYCKDIINRARNSDFKSDLLIELNSSKQSYQQIDSNISDTFDARVKVFKAWLRANYENNTRIEINKDFKVAYRKHFGEALKVDDIAMLFKSTGSWLVNKSGNVYYAIKI